MGARIRSLGLHGAQPQSDVRIAVASEGDLRVDVGVANANGEVHRDAPIVASDRSQNGPAANAITGLHGRLGEIGVRGLDTTMVDAHGAVPNHDARK